MNKAILMGRLTRDPDVRYSNNGDKQMAVARYTLAVDRLFERDKTDFINCVAFNKDAEFAEKYFKKGIKIVVEGHIQTGSYKNKDGQTVYTTDVVIERQEFAESKNQANNAGNNSNGTNYHANAGNGQNGANNASQGYSIPSPASAIGDDFMNIPDGVEDEQLPFN